MAKWGIGLAIVGTVLAVTLFTVAIVLVEKTDCSTPQQTGTFAERICKAKNGD